MSSSPANAWLFDVDGVICHPEQKRITKPEIITEIIKRLQKGEPVALVTGRSVEFMRGKVIALLKDKMKDFSLLQNFLAVGEKGGVMLTFDDSGTEVETIDRSISVPPQIQKETKQLIASKYSREAFFDPTKRTMISLEMTDHFPLDQFTKAQKFLDKDVRSIVAKYIQDNNYVVDSSTISTDIQNSHVGKHFAAAHVLEWLQKKGISPKHFIAIGDSAGDLEMAREINGRGLSVEFVFVGDPANIRGKSGEFPIRVTGSQFELGTLEYLQSRD